MQDFYDELAPDHHLIFTDWDASIARQAKVLDRAVRRAGARPHPLTAPPRANPPPSFLATSTYKTSTGVE
ncbi:hypothetical protein GCM10011579_058900 [Streptomyces albiflavescens]|uniref:Uncharacterized protein n=1 Tax=Streptomyces albiflavescens TaxID=1623582 RepID=A0A917Y959_9ACTN|nr:hypothetical protein GCM10011579_058900 [Streptomyces albiflavescens]